MPTFYHVSSVQNRESIRRYGLDWTKMGQARGIAGSRKPEVEGCFLCIEAEEAEWFVRINNTGTPVDVWAIDGIEPDQLLSSPEGYSYFPEPIAPHRLSLVRQDVPPARIHRE